MMSFIDDQHWQLSLLLDQACDFVAKRLPLADALSLLNQSEFEREAVQGFESAAGGQRYIGRFSIREKQNFN